MAWAQSDAAIVMGGSAAEEKAIADLTAGKTGSVAGAAAAAAGGAAGGGRRVVIDWNFAQREVCKPAMQALLGVVRHCTCVHARARVRACVCVCVLHVWALSCV